MRELLTMWRDTRMVMLVAVVAAVYAALLIPFKLFTILPGLTSVRPANVLPVFFGIAFGPAAAWGSAIGNLIGDVFGGTFGPGSVGGFVGNFFFGLVGYKLWGNLGPLSSGEEPDFRDQKLRQLIEYVAVAVAAAAACAAIIAWVVDALELIPFSVLGPIILTNNAVSAIVLGPPLFYLAYPRVKEMGLLYPDVLRARTSRVGPTPPAPGRSWWCRWSGSGSRCWCSGARPGRRPRSASAPSASSSPLSRRTSPARTSLPSFGTREKGNGFRRPTRVSTR
ncbi:QueT transporter family protein [Halolamina rubra]|uniref:QueT transporter family protein n=1 Tax=Halolamina rubra TaxID=1380430 RepID=UPI000AAEB382|nr:QueT transporter family protein [Halolamina rubra]